MLSIIASPVIAQYGVVVQYTSNHEQTFILNNQGKIYFSDNNLIIDQSNGLTQTIDIADIRKLYFRNNLSINEDVVSDDNINIYPNPASNNFKLSNIKPNSLISIYSLDGRLLINQYNSSDQYIYIDNLQKGLYIVKVENKTFKLIKQ